MKRNLWRIAAWILLSFAVCLWMISGCSAGKKPLTDEEAYQRFVGTWVNTDYPGTLEFTQVTVIRPDYVGEDWQMPDSPSPIGEWTIKIKKTWVDEKGYTYIQSYITRTKPSSAQHSVAALMRVDKKGKVYECVLEPFGGGSEETAMYPEKIDPNLQWDWIYYRKK